MKLLFLIFAFSILSGCVSQASSISDVSKTAQPTPPSENSNSNSNAQYSYSDYQYDQTLMDKLDEQNDRFRQVPDEFKHVDFKNFKYDFGRLKNGNFEKEYSKKYAQGGERFRFQEVFYTNLIGDAKKEALVFLSRLSCGVSCDGGADIIYFYSSNKGKAQFIDILETGPNSGGCSLKSFAIRDKKLYVEQFGKCVKNPLYDMDNPYVCKFCANGETHSIYSISKDGLKRESVNVFDTKAVNVMNSPAFISINE